MSHTYANPLDRTIWPYIEAVCKADPDEYKDFPEVYENHGLPDISFVREVNGTHPFRIVSYVVKMGDEVVYLREGEGIAGTTNTLRPGAWIVPLVNLGRRILAPRENAEIERLIGVVSEKRDRFAPI